MNVNSLGAFCDVSVFISKVPISGIFMCVSVWFMCEVQIIRAFYIWSVSMPKVQILDDFVIFRFPSVKFKLGVFRDVSVSMYSVWILGALKFVMLQFPCLTLERYQAHFGAISSMLVNSNINWKRLRSDCFNCYIALNIDTEAPFCLKSLKIQTFAVSWKVNIGSNKYPQQGDLWSLWKVSVSIKT